MTPYYDEDGITIYHADCRDVFSVFPQDYFDFVLTDPPYASGARRDAERQVRGAMLRSLEDDDWFSHDSMTSWGFSWFIRSVFTDMRPLLKEGSHLYVFTDWRQAPNVYGMLESSGYRVNQCLVWAKSHYGMGSYWRNQHENIVFASHGMPAPMIDRGMGSVLTEKAVSPLARVHPTEKPVSLLMRILKAAPCTHVIDQFMGSGSTLIAAKTLGLRAVGIEIEERHCENAALSLRQTVMHFDVADKPEPISMTLDWGVA